MTDEEEKDVKEHPITVAERRTGLSAHAIRKWEERYDAVKPGRSPGGHRLFSNKDIRRLQLLNDAVQTGRTIGQVSSMSDEKLLEYIRSDSQPDLLHSRAAEGGENDFRGETILWESYIEPLLEAATALNGKGLHELLLSALVDLGKNTVTDRLVPRFMQMLGAKWQEGVLRIVHEHLATEAVRQFLITFLDSENLPHSAPVAIATTAEDQWHDIGSLTAAVVAVSAGWRTVYAGPNTPVEEIAAAANTMGAGVILLSYTYPGDPEEIKQGLYRLSKYLAGNTEIIIGGAPSELIGGDKANPALPEHVSIIPDFPALREKLAQLRPTN